MAEQMKNVLYGEIIGDDVAGDKLFGKNANKFKEFLNKVVSAIAVIKK